MHPEHRCASLCDAIGLFCCCYYNKIESTAKTGMKLKIETTTDSGAHFAGAYHTDVIISSLSIRGFVERFSLIAIE